MKALLLILAVAFSPSAWCAGWSGTYTASGRDVSFHVQLVETSGGVAVGRYKEVSIGKDGKLNTVDAPLSGAVNGELFVGKVDRPWSAGGSIAISGRRTATSIELTGAGGLRASLRPGTDADEEKAVAVLRQRVEQSLLEAQQYKLRREQEEKYKKRVELLEGFLRDANNYVLKGSLTYQLFNEYPARYEAATKSLEESLAKVRSTPGNSGDAQGRRSTLTASMLHKKIDETEHPQIDVKHARDASVREWQKLTTALNSATKPCAESSPPSLNISRFNELCLKVPGALQAVERAGKASSAEFDQIKAVFVREYSKQEELLAEANRMSRRYENR